VREREREREIIIIIIIIIIKTYPILKGSIIYKPDPYPKQERFNNKKGFG